MTTRRARRPMARRAILPVLCCAAVACSEGYPGRDEPIVEPSRMSAPQLLEAMNRLGAEKHLAARWRYVLAEGCVLEVRARNGVSSRRQVALGGAAVEARAEDKVFEVLVRPRAKSGGAVTALASRRWADSVRMRSLLASLVRHCEAPADEAA